MHSNLKKLFTATLMGALLAGVGQAQAAFRRITDKRHSPYMTYEADELKTGNPKIDAVIHAYVKSVRRDWYNYDHKEIHLAHYRNELQLNYTLSRGPSGLLSVLYTNFQYTGGAHPMTFFKTMIFDLKTGKMLGLNDIFANNGGNYLERLGVISRQRLKAALESMYDEEMANDGTKPLASNFDLITLEPKGFNLRFDLYQVASYAASGGVFYIPYNSVKSSLSPAFIQRYLRGKL